MATTGYKDIDHILMCNWYNSTNGTWACFPSDGYEWRPRNVILLNALPLNAFNSRIRLDIIPVQDISALLNTLKDLPHNYKCYIGHTPTSLLIRKYIPVDCTRGMYTYSHDDLLIAFVLKTRTPTSGVDANVDINDLLAYVIIPSPIL